MINLPLIENKQASSNWWWLQSYKPVNHIFGEILKVSCCVKILYLFPLAMLSTKNHDNNQRSLKFLYTIKPLGDERQVPMFFLKYFLEMFFFLCVYQPEVKVTVFQNCKKIENEITCWKLNNVRSNDRIIIYQVIPNFWIT